MPNFNLLEDIEWKLYDGSVESERDIQAWIYNFAIKGQFKIHPKHTDGRLHISPGTYVIETPLGFRTERYDAMV